MNWWARVQEVWCKIADLNAPLDRGHLEFKTILNGKSASAEIIRGNLDTPSDNAMLNLYTMEIPTALKNMTINMKWNFKWISFSNILF